MNNSPAILSPQPWHNWPVVRHVTEAFAQAGAPLRFVGGCVRDSLLERPVQDVDAATPLPPQQVIALLEKAGIRTIPTGIDHGTVTAVVEGKPLEITTLRRDMACDGRHAKVEYTDNWQEDAARRDFTINALYAAPDGTLYDYFGGLADLGGARVKFIGDPAARIEEDALRILRFFRFNAQLQSQPLESSGREACAEHAVQIQKLSGERIAQEMFRLLRVPVLETHVFNAMEEAGLLPYLKLPPVPAALFRHGEGGDATLAPLVSRARLALWLLEANDPAEALQELRERWKLSNADHAFIASLLRNVPYLTPDLPLSKQKSLLRLCGRDLFRHTVMVAKAWFGEAKKYVPLERLAEEWEIPQFPVTGEDLIAEGYLPGPELGKALATLETIWEAEDYRPDKKALLARVRRQTG